jgi:hypothetical protein
MRTTLDINDALLKQIRSRAGETGKPVKRVLEEVLQLGLGQLERSQAATNYKVKPHALGLKAAYRGQSLNQLYDQLEAEDSAK